MTLEITEEILQIQDNKIYIHKVGMHRLDYIFQVLLLPS